MYVRKVVVAVVVDGWMMVLGLLTVRSFVVVDVRRRRGLVRRGGLVARDLEATCRWVRGLMVIMKGR